MFCGEVIEKVYVGVIEEDDVYSHNAFLDCCHDIAYHCTKGYRIVLATENYRISLSVNGVTKEDKDVFRENDEEWLQNGVEYFDGEESPYVRFETTLFVGERIRAVTESKGVYFVQFDDFQLKIIPYEQADDIQELRNADYWSSKRVLGCDRHLKRKCPACGENGEIYIDFAGDYYVQCRKCGHSTWASKCVIEAIEEWNEREDLSP